ncbi:MAG TPA: sugar ABC transporter permease [bacterium]|nr:sugar ABC transporter permease [bacterium]
MVLKLKGKNRRLFNDTLLDVALVSPQLLLYLLFLIVPLFIGLPIVFTNMRGFADHQRTFVGLKNFYDLLIRPGYERNILYNSIYRNTIFFIINYLTVYLFGLSFALLMYAGRFGHGFFTIIYLPMMVSQLAIGYIMTMLFSKSTGSLNLLLLQLDLISQPINIQSSAGSTWIVPLIVGWEFAGYNLAIFLSGLYSIPNETVEASIIDGTSYLQRLRYVIFPQMKDSFVIATVMCITGSYQIFDQAVALGGLGGNKNVEFVAIGLWKFMFRHGAVGKAMTMTFIIGIPLFIFALFFTKRQKKMIDRGR